ncbi:MAG TPA: fused MFS/spermidine synthase [Chloroflexota bacterium]|nr:fused MFS/spermidine synthase [Chloroflexota bacterium]
MERASSGLVVRPVAAPAAARWLLPLLAILFFASGASGLVYQVLWLRLLALVFGVTVWAVSTVLASFMAGLALGSLVAGRLVDRARSPLLWYGVAEGLTGLAALATPAALDLLVHVYTRLYPALPQELGVLTAVRFVLSFGVLLVPTTLMGATLPLVVKSSLLQAEGLGQSVSLLYATNTAGAVAGTLLAGFVLVGGVGLEASFRLAAALNLLVGLVAISGALALQRQRGEALAPPGVPPVAPHRAPAALPARSRGLILLVFTLSGFASLALEVIWFRTLVLYFDATTYAFTIMLGTVLLGIAVGSFLIAPLMRWQLDWLALLAGLELAIGITAVLSLAALTRTQEAATWLGLLLRRPLVSPVALTSVASFLALFPTTLLLGMAFPIGLRLWAGDEEGASQAGERVGLFYALNVCGAILGSVVAGFLLLPWLGSQHSLVAVASVSFGAGLLLLLALRRPRRALLLAGPGVALFLAAVAGMPDPFAQALASRYRGEQLLWHEEGVQTTVTVHQRPSGARVLYLDGRYQASDEPGQVLIHRMVGHLPLALHPQPRDVLIVGLGGGVTAGAVSRHGAEVDVVELSGSVVRGADWFRHVNDDPLHRPNVHLRVDDGRNYLLLTAKRYDVITSDLIGPTHAGAGALYSAEYFRLARAALRDDGLMLQWLVPLPETQHKLIVRTFLSVFPEATLWFQGTLLVGTKQPLWLDPAAFERKLANPDVRAALATVGLDSFEALLAQYWAGPAELQRYAGPGPILTDDRPLVEYFLSLPRGERMADLSAVRGDPRRHLRGAAQLGHLGYSVASSGGSSSSERIVGE